jgi:hypothetical protein
MKTETGTEIVIIASRVAQCDPPDSSRQTGHDRAGAAVNLQVLYVP